MILGMLVFRALAKNGFKGRGALISFLICAVYATSDEFHQLFVPGRGCQLKDVVIDSTGYIVGISINRLYFRLKKTGAFKGYRYS